MDIYKLIEDIYSELSTFRSYEDRSDCAQRWLKRAELAGLDVTKFRAKSILVQDAEASQ
jgi:hypothetical protein